MNIWITFNVFWRAISIFLTVAAYKRKHTELEQRNKDKEAIADIGTQLPTVKNSKQDATGLVLNEVASSAAARDVVRERTSPLKEVGKLEGVKQNRRNRRHSVEPSTKEGERDYGDNNTISSSRFRWARLASFPTGTNSKYGTPMYRALLLKLNKPTGSKSDDRSSTVDQLAPDMGNNLDQIQTRTSQLKCPTTADEKSTDSDVFNDDNGKCLNKNSTLSSSVYKDSEVLTISDLTRLPNVDGNWDNSVDSEEDINSNAKNFVQDASTDVCNESTSILSLNSVQIGSEPSPSGTVMLPKHPCTFIVKGSNPGEPKRNFREDFSNHIPIVPIVYPDRKPIHCEGKINKVVGGILKRHLNYSDIDMEVDKGLKDGGDTDAASQAPVSANCGKEFEDTAATCSLFETYSVAPYHYQYSGHKKKGIKRVNFHMEVDVISYAGGEGGAVVSRTVEPLKNEKLQQDRNSYLRKGYTVFRIQRIEAWPRHLKTATSNMKSAMKNDI